MSEVDVQATPVESSTPAPAAPATSGIEVDSSDLGWRKTGVVTPKEPKEAPPKKETSAPSTETTSADSTDDELDELETASESDPGKPSSGERKPHKGTPANVRIKQLLDRIKALESKQAPPTQADPSPAKPAEKAVELKKPTRPKLSDYDGSQGKTAEDYDVALEKYEEARDSYTKAVAKEEYRQEQANLAAQSKLGSELDQAKARYDNFDVKVINDAAGEIWNDQQINPLVKDKLGKSDVAIDLLYTLTGDQAFYQEFLKLSKSDPVAAITKLAFMENDIRAALQKGKAEKTEKTETAETAPVRNDKGQFESGKTPAKVTSAPPPPREASGKGIPPPDEVQSAFQADADDIGIDNYRAAANRRDLARRKG